MADAAFKPEKDFSKEADKLIPEAEKLAKSDIQGAIEKLSVLEKQARQVSPRKTTNVPAPIQYNTHAALLIHILHSYRHQISQLHHEFSSPSSRYAKMRVTGAYSTTKSWFYPRSTVS